MDNGVVSTEQGSQPEGSHEPEALVPELPNAGTEPKRRVGLLLGVALLIFGLDLVTKIVVASTLEGSEPIRALGGLVYFQLVRNGGAAFGMATGMTWLFALAAAVVAGVVLWLARRLRSVGWAIGLGLVLAGAIGNLVDRIFRAPGPLEGQVVDFISLFAPDGDIWPVFNIADSAICIGAALIVLVSLLGHDYNGRSTKAKPTRPEQDA